jgi:acyl dehydratase
VVDNDLLDPCGMTVGAARAVGGPYLDDLRAGQRFDAPAMTLTDGHAALHQAIVGDRLRLCLDHELARAVTGGEAPLAHPQLVCDVAIGQSTTPTQRVIANLFYRGLVLHRAARIGDTLHTSTSIVATKRNRGDRSTGLALLRIRTVDQRGRTVLDFHRCAMLPLSDAAEELEPTEFAAPPAELPAPPELAGAAREWDLAPVRALPGPHFADVASGDTWRVEGADVVTAAAELARLSLNVAEAHHGRVPRLVYGGHTIGLALSQTTRALPNLVTVVAWHACDHVGPVGEGDRLRSSGEIEAMQPLPGGGGLVHLHVRVDAERTEGPEPVLDWRPVGLMA